MLLCDIGNTSYHFLQGETNYKKSVLTFDPRTLKETVHYICVEPRIKKLLKTLANWIDLSEKIDKSTYYPTMGIDRIVACQAIQNGVVVDAGSAITVDVVSEGVFKGGFIYPGSRFMKEAYKNISSALDYEFNYELDLSTLPKNSQDAISFGYLKLLYSEINSYKMPIVLTGGDASLLKHIFPQAQINSTLIFDGMKKLI